VAAYEELRRRHLDDVRARATEYIERLDWPAERLAAHRHEELRRLVRVAQQRSPWHRKRLGHLAPEEVDETALPELPVMTKDDLMAHFDEIVTDERLTLDVVEAHFERLTGDAYLFDRYHAVASGGSTGSRGVFVYDRDGWTTCYLGFLRYELRARALDPDLATAPAVMASVAAGHATHMSSALFQTFTSPEVSINRFPISLPVAEIVAGLNEVQPTVLQGYPSGLHALTYEARAGRLRIRPQRILSGSEPLLPEIRAALEDTWGVPVCNWWGTSEAGPVAVGCGQGRNMHLSDDLVIVEPVDKSGRLVGPGERSAKIYLTNLFNQILPLIRYEITDEVVTLDEAQCSCGSAHRLIDDIHGRLDETFTYGGLAVHPHLFRSPLGRRPQVLEYQVRQTRRGAAIAVRTRGQLDFDALRSDIVEGLTRIGFTAPDVSITPVERLERQPTGKLKRFVPLSQD
jgi:phenylacetate-coenzyme A ligase PaaK-like adenylate-forming protein